MEFLGGILYIILFCWCLLGLYCFYAFKISSCCRTQLRRLRRRRKAGFLILILKRGLILVSQNKRGINNLQICLRRIKEANLIRD